MATNRLEDLFHSGDDGASTPLPPLALRDEAERESILDAWYRERHHSIEFEMLLRESRALIARLLASDPPNPAERKRAFRLMRSIERALREKHAGGA